MKKTPKGIKFDKEKVPLYLLSNYALEEAGRVLQFGATKYHAWNWTEGIVFSRVISAAKRHIAAWENRIDLDEETRTNHLANAMVNLMFLLDYQARGLTYLDDRRPQHTLKQPSKKRHNKK